MNFVESLSLAQEKLLFATVLLTETYVCYPEFPQEDCFFLSYDMLKGKHQLSSH